MPVCRRLWRIDRRGSKENELSGGGFAGGGEHTVPDGPRAERIDVEQSSGKADRLACPGPFSNHVIVEPPAVRPPGLLCRLRHDDIDEPTAFNQFPVGKWRRHMVLWRH